jgi:hypothetical protein
VGLRDLLRRVTFEIGGILRSSPQLYLPIARWRRKAVPVDRDTDIVIEGYPRSGNTFALTAFGSAQTQAVRVAHHEHAAAQVVAATRAGIPALVLIREPAEAVLSFTIQHPHLSLRQALRGYVRFYRPLLPHRDRFVLATFEEVTTDFGAVTRRVNARFGTDFGVFEHTEENVERCLAAIREHGVARRGPVLVHRTGSSPSTVRAAIKDTARRGYGDPGLRRLRTKAETVYRLLASRT